MTSSYESAIDRQIREATARGDFDDLPGAGKPLPDSGTPLDEEWWLKSYIARGELGSEALPTTLRLRKQIEELPQTLAKLRTEEQVREAIDELNKQIRSALLGPAEGPSVPLCPVDAEDAVRKWRQRR